MFHNGIGAILTKRGEYLDSISAYLHAHSIASRVGNESLAVQASSNLALSFVRVGEYEKAIEWAHRVRACQTSDLTPECYLPAALAYIVGNAMLGRTSQAEASICEHNEKFKNYGSAAMSQAWAFYAADGYAMLGDIQQAARAGLECDFRHKREHPLPSFRRTFRSLGCEN